MSVCNFKSFKIGQSLTASQNFVLQSHDDGTMTLKRGNPGAETDTILTVGSTGLITSPQFSQLPIGMIKWDGTNTGTFTADAFNGIFSGSITRTGAGDYTASFTSAEADADYIVSISTGAFAHRINTAGLNDVTLTTSNTSNVGADSDYVSMMIWRVS